MGCSIGRCPEPIAAPPDVPVGQIVDESLDYPAAVSDSVALEQLVVSLGDPIETQKDPPIQRARLVEWYGWSDRASSRRGWRRW